MIIRMLKDNSGIGITILTLLIIPVLLLMWISSVNITKSVSDYDVGLQAIVAEAVKNASFMVDRGSMALGKPTINSDLALEAFHNIINTNIKHGNVGGYQLVVFNYGYGDNGDIHIYKYNDGSLQYEKHEDIEGEKTFYVSNDGISLTSGDNKITLDEPGCIGIAWLDSEEFLGRGETEGARWAVSSIYLAKDFN